MTKGPRIFICYRRADSADVTGRVYDRLCPAFGDDHVFKDVDSIPMGTNFREYLDRAVSECDVFLAMIGTDWLDASGPDGSRMLDSEGDFVRIEIESALRRGIPVVPALVRGASVPSMTELPQSIKDLSERQGVSVRSDPDFHRDMDRLISGIEAHWRRSRKSEHEGRGREANGKAGGSPAAPPSTAKLRSADEIRASSASCLDAAPAAAVEPQSVRPGIAAEPAATRPARRRRVVIALIALVVLSVTAYVLMAWRHTEAGIAHAERFLAALKDGDYQRAVVAAEYEGDASTRKLRNFQACIQATVLDDLTSFHCDDTGSWSSHPLGRVHALCSVTSKRYGAHRVAIGVNNASDAAYLAFIWFPAGAQMSSQWRSDECTRWSGRAFGGEPPAGFVRP